MIQRITIPDTSFYSCFIGDIERPDHLLKILNANRFKFIAAKIICSEIERKLTDTELKQKIFQKIEMFSYYEYGEILRPLFSEEEMKKGEQEVIVISYILNFKKEHFIAILDDKTPKNFLKRLIQTPSGIVMGTIGFIGLCASDGIFEKEEAVSVLILIKGSKFRVNDKIIDVVIQRIHGTQL
jgi:predicted nucleic acid-binding protein